MGGKFRAFKGVWGGGGGGERGGGGGAGGGGGGKGRQRCCPISWYPKGDGLRVGLHQGEKEGRGDLKARGLRFF